MRFRHGGRSPSRAEDKLPLRAAAEQVLVCVAGPRQVVRRADQGPQAAPRREVEQFRQLRTAGSVPGDEWDDPEASDGDATAVEDERAKTELFQQLAKVVTNPSAVLASNTSSIPIARLAAVTGRPQAVVGLHFFNPVPAMPLVEVIPSMHTSKATEQRVRAFAAETLGKKTIVTQDRAGFVINSLLIPYLLAAVRMVGSGTGTAEDIDTAMTAGCAHPMGPLRLADLIGLDTVAAIGEALYEEYREPLYAPPPLLRRMVESGLLGRKSGQGFFNYQAP
jgi:3-hydroxybutyryl-CoA dehydrogenase